SLHDALPILPPYPDDKLVLEAHTFPDRLIVAVTHLRSTSWLLRVSIGMFSLIALTHDWPHSLGSLAGSGKVTHTPSWMNCAVDSIMRLRRSTRHIHGGGLTDQYEVPQWSLSTLLVLLLIWMRRSTR